MGKCIIITPYINGELKNIVRRESGDFVLCADNGYNAAAAAGIEPDLVIGDYDSLDSPIPETVKKISYPVHKDYTDTGLCIDWAVSNGFSHAAVIGGLGGRLDHSIANIQDIAGFASKGIRLEMYDEFNYITVMCGHDICEGKACDLSHIRVGCDIFARGDEDKVKEQGYDGLRLGLLAFSKEVTGVCSSGVEYPLENAVLESTFPLGAGNYFTSAEADIKISAGVLLVTVSKNT